ncbi:MAG: hypothetical protein KDD25_03990, partial [Bdellovibrionales bacterium]|nr:hypothetical protein [Bdellovibrionales bacterium]
MRISKSKQVAAFVLLLVISGCKGSFQAREFQSTADGVLGGSPNVTTTTLPPNPGSNSIDVPSGMLFSVRDNLFKVKNPVAGEQYQWSYTLSGRNDECIAEASESEYMVFCKLPGLLKVKLTVTEVGGARKNYETADLQVNSQHETGTVKFVIPEGTANDPWNTEEKV